MDLNKILLDIKLPVDRVSPESIQTVFTVAKRYNNAFVEKDELWENIIETLWKHLKTGFEKFDDQLRCATCFYSVLHLSENQEQYLKEIEILISQDVNMHKNSTEYLNIEQLVSLMNGLFRSTFLLQENLRQINSLPNLLQIIFRLLIDMAYEYSKVTGVVFQTICLLKKVCGTDLEKYLLNKENQIRLLNLVNHNWENPLTGIRDITKEIFQMLLFILDNEMYDKLLQEVNAFYWNKAKYTMLAEIVKHSNKNVMDLVEDNDWINGLISSLSKPGLVSAGADMYFEILKKIKNESEWSKLFMKSIINILKHTCRKAVENFGNYWCLTTLKSYPSLALTLINETEHIQDSEQKLYSCLCIAKQVNRLGLIRKNRALNPSIFLEKTCLLGLEHCDNQIRLMAFEILSVSQKKILREKTDYDLVLEFLNNNFNSDCTVLRISMLNSFSAFISELHTSYINNFEKSQDIDKENIENFCSNLQQLIVMSLDGGGNYQRKITCIKLMQMFMDELSTVKLGKGNCKPLIQMLQERGCWTMHDEIVITHLIMLLKDPANDVREAVIKLLMSHFSKQISQATMMNMLIEEALKSMKSKFFHEIGCGQTLFKLIVNIMFQENLDATFRTVEDVFNFACDELISEYKKQRSILESIEKGKQLHSFLSILYAVFQVCLQKNYKITISDEKMCELLEVLEATSNQFAWEQESTSSDFAKISDMVQSFIECSGLESCDQNDQTKISGLEQIILNCLWLNVKGSCELMSLLTKQQKDDSGIRICNKTLQIISHVLETCRHKGAIEAAGAAFGQTIQHLTSFRDNRISEIPEIFLKDKLIELINETARMSSVTRRGAGLSIMVHRIVSSDVRRHKPLFHYFMKTILDTCNSTNYIPSSIENAENIDNEKDLPKAIYIHFLTRIVTDSSLASHMMFYSAKLAELAFGNLTSPFWQIRNAALQLYGALIQKLIGQKKAAGENEEAIATVACDELRTHSPNLWRHIQRQLQENYYEDKIQYHSNLVPILNMLANTAKRYNFQYDLAELQKSDEDLLKNLLQLLDSPIYSVRRLTAKCIYNIYEFEIVYQKLVTENIDRSENYLHGILLLIANYNKHQNIYKKYRQKFAELRMKYDAVMKAKVHSYLCREIFDEVFPECLDVSQIRQDFVELNLNKHSPGIFQWEKKRIERVILDSSWEKIPPLLCLILDYGTFEEYSKFLLLKLQDSREIPLMSKDIVLELLIALLEYKNKFHSSSVWKILYLLCSNTNLNCEESSSMISEDFLKYFKNGDISYNLRYMIPFATRTLALAGDVNNLLHVAKVIASLTEPETDVEMRYIAAIAINEIGAVLKSLSEDCKIEIIKSAVILLQDEDEDVRTLSANFYPKVMNMKISLQPYICLLKILSHTFLRSVLSENGKNSFCAAMTQFIDKNIRKVVDEYNPFSNECNNIYIEFKLFRNLIETVCE